MADTSLIDAARKLGAKSGSGIVQAKGGHWPPPPTISIRSLLHWQPNVDWKNYEQTQEVVGVSVYTPESLEDIVAIVRDAERNGQQVHAFGSKWSFSACALGLDVAPAPIVLPDGTVLHLGMNVRLIDMTAHVESDPRINPAAELNTVQRAMVSGDPAHVYHVKAGITIQQLYGNLTSKGGQGGLALETMGGSSGQTLAGAISTGTHGGDLFMGSLADSVLAIHLVGAGGTQYWIEPFPGITDPTLLRQFVAPDIDPNNIIYDNSWFEAVLVSLGCMGIIYAVVLRVRDQYNLTETATKTTWRDFVRSAVGLLDGTSDPTNRFLQVIVNPYQDDTGNRTCLVVKRKEGGSSFCSCAKGDVNGAVAALLNDLILQAEPILMVKLEGDAIWDFLHHRSPTNTVFGALTGLVNYVLAAEPGLQSVFVKHYESIMEASWPPVTCGGKSYCVMDTERRMPASNGMPGYNSIPPTPRQSPDPEAGFSIEMLFEAVDSNGHLPWLDFVDSMLTAINAATNTVLVGYFAIRFCGTTDAYLGMQQFNMNCCVEISGLRVQGLLELVTTFLDSMYKNTNGFPHWGHLIDLNVKGDGSRYPRYQEWRRIYGLVSNNFTARTFENSVSTSWRLTTP